MKIQALFVKRVIAFDRTLEGKNVKIAFIHAGESKEIVDTALEAFSAVGLTAVAVKAGEFNADSIGANVAFLTTAALTPAVLAECEKAQMLTITSTAEPASEGQVCLGFAKREDGKPQLIVHLTRTRNQGHDISSGLLNLVTVIR